MGLDGGGGGWNTGWHRKGGRAVGIKWGLNLLYCIVALA